MISPRSISIVLPAGGGSALGSMSG